VQEAAAAPDPILAPSAAALADFTTFPGQPLPDAGLASLAFGQALQGLGGPAIAMGVPVGGGGEFGGSAAWPVRASALAA